MAAWHYPHLQMQQQCSNKLPKANHADSGSAKVAPTPWFLYFYTDYLKLNQSKI